MEKRSLVDQARSILEGKSLADKLVRINIPKFDFKDEYEASNPGRSNKIKFSEKRFKFPKNFESKESRARAIHAFANHELLAIEIMALALIKFPSKGYESFKKSVISSLHDEQEHFLLYEKRLNDLGYEFGDFAINDYFWKQAIQMKKPEHFSSMMSLTFEAANLDFSFYYQQKFKEIEDTDSSLIMKQVFDDEISHVKSGVHFMNQWRRDLSLWEYYQENLIFPLTPARSIGISYDREFRKAAGFNASFIESLESFDDGFKITKRK